MTQSITTLIVQLTTISRNTFHILTHPLQSLQVLRLLLYPETCTHVTTCTCFASRHRRQESFDSVTRNLEHSHKNNRKLQERNKELQGQNTLLESQLEDTISRAKQEEIAHRTQSNSLQEQLETSNTKITLCETTHQAPEKIAEANKTLLDRISALQRENEDLRHEYREASNRNRHWRPLSHSQPANLPQQLQDSLSENTRLKAEVESRSSSQQEIINKLESAEQKIGQLHTQAQKYDSQRKADAVRIKDLEKGGRGGVGGTEGEALWAMCNELVGFFRKYGWWEGRDEVYTKTALQVAKHVPVVLERGGRRIAELEVSREKLGVVKKVREEQRKKIEGMEKMVRGWEEDVRKAAKGFGVGKVGGGEVGEYIKLTTKKLEQYKKGERDTSTEKDNAIRRLRAEVDMLGTEFQKQETDKVELKERQQLIIDELNAKVETQRVVIEDLKKRLEENSGSGKEEMEVKLEEDLRG